jgi:hypothetical protein
MKKIFFLLAAVCTFFACDPVHEDISNTSHITLDELLSKSSVTVDQAADGQNGNVITCNTSAPVTAKWTFCDKVFDKEKNAYVFDDGKDLIGNFASKKMKVGEHLVKLTAYCADGTVLTADYPMTCDVITQKLNRYWIYGENPEAQPPFSPGAWDAAAMRFSSTEGAHLPTIPDEVYDGLKTLIFDVSDVTPDFDLKVMNGWWSNTYYDHVKWVNGLNELQITATMARECAKKYVNDDPAGGKDLDLMLYSGSMTLNSVYYEE